MRAREVLWERRWVSKDGYALFMNESTTHPDYPETKKYVRAFQSISRSDHHISNLCNGIPNHLLEVYYLVKDLGEEGIELMEISSWNMAGSVPKFFLPGPDQVVKDIKKVKKIIARPRPQSVPIVKLSEKLNPSETPARHPSLSKVSS